MNILSPDYGQSILARFSKDITKYDYTNLPIDKNPLRNQGVLILIWDGKYSVKISYKNDSVHFLIEDDYYKYIDSSISNNVLTKAHYEYFSDAFEYLKSHEENLRSIKSEFTNLPNSYIRNEKLNELIKN